MMRLSGKNYPFYLVGAGVIVLLIIGSVLYTAAHRQSEEPVSQVTNTPTISPSANSTVAPVVESASPTAGGTATPSPVSTQNTISLPDSAKSFLANFYAAYSDKDRDRLSQAFSPDPTDELKSLHARLFTGIDTNGNPGGPTLFSSNAVLEKVVSYEILGAAPQDKNWVVTVKEQRILDNGKTVPNVTTLITLIPAPSGQGTWAIDAYAHAGATAKYDGFYTQ